MNGVAQWVTLAVGVVGGLSGMAALLNAVVGRGKTRADTAQVITGTAITWINEFEEDARNARTEASGLRQEMASVRAEARALADELYQLRTAIMRPNATVESLRLMVGGGAANGRAG